MGTKELMTEIQRLPIGKRMLLIEQTLRSIRESDLKKRMGKATDALLNDYRSDDELTAFTALDFEGFYEAR